MSIEMIEVEAFNSGTQIKVIGVGGGGGNAVEHMISSGVQGVEFVTANTDAQALRVSNAHKVIQLGSTGLGAGSKPDRGREAAEAAIDDIRLALEGTNMLFVTAGMGGGTGTGAAPVVARVAREMGILTVGVVTKPFEFEGSRRMNNAETGLAELEANVDSLIVVLNEKLMDVLGEDASQDEAFAFANDVLKNSVGGIAEIINVEALVNVDFEDVRTVMSETGKAMMGTAAANGPDRARIAAEQAVACPLLEGVDMSGAKGVLVLITAAKGGLKLSESREAMNTIRKFASPDAHVIYGTAYDESLGDQIRVTVVATGLAGSRRAAPQLQVLRTGTDGVGFPTTQANNASPAGVLAAASSGLAGLAAGLGVGSVAAQPNYDAMNSPAVWRGNRTSAAAKVDALSSGGMDDYEIPAFLRKQAD
ncbi:cell division protein FtsZ [Limnohabitans sp. Rim8]|jgi:cell division protein FtsZ|uniref:Cell division protein FtsZ n=1 Tax=Limnohabitans curvus TaxID=323423 RepID=A0A315EPT1_9BURK|nr:MULTISPECIES: cell division protein FtsZ [Limnohabitans]PUE56661.1 cell division protein FtsZ [Limnohabitans sp. Rim8]PUE59763.1 cell division protein FtsZ [Limnohabitans curvus]BDU52159.1 cell division protein FtsZ [Limnohabitans sp. INBF002]